MTSLLEIVYCISNACGEMFSIQCVVPEKYPYPAQGGFLEIPHGNFHKDFFFFGGGRGLNQKSLPGRMDIF